jgi:hypothetical protein
MKAPCRQIGDRRRQGPPPFAGMGMPIEPRYAPDDSYNIRHDPDGADKIMRLLQEGWRDHPGEPVVIWPAA